MPRQVSAQVTPGSPPRAHQGAGGGEGKPKGPDAGREPRERHVRVATSHNAQYIETVVVLLRRCVEVRRHYTPLPRAAPLRAHKHTSHQQWCCHASATCVHTTPAPAPAPHHPATVKIEIVCVCAHAFSHVGSAFSVRERPLRCGRSRANSRANAVRIGSTRPARQTTHMHTAHGASRAPCKWTR